MKVYLIGATGFLGSQLKRQLETNFDVICHDRHNFDISDMLSDTLIEKVKNTDIVINCAAIINSDLVESMLDVNAKGALNVAKFAHAIGAKLIHVSSFFCETDSRNEYFNYYGISKLAGEHYIAHYAKCSGLEYSIVRCAQIYDVNGDARYSQALLYGLINKTKDQNEITMVGDKDVERNYVNVEVVCKGIEKVIMNNINGLTYILGETFKISEILNILSSVRKKQIKLTWNSELTSLKTIFIPSKITNVVADLLPRFEQDIKEIIKHE